MPVRKPIYHEQARWTAVRVVKIDGRHVERHVLEIEKEHVGLATLGLGHIQKNDVGKFYVIDADQQGAGPADYIVDANPLAKSIAGEPSWLITFLDTRKRTVDHAIVKAPSRNDARRMAIDLYAKNGDKATYAGFVVTQEEHGGY